MEIKKVFQLILTLTLFFLMVCDVSSDVAIKPGPSSQKIVKGFRGEAKVMARQWLQKEKKIVSLKFTSGNKGQFWNKGILEGKLTDGTIVSVVVVNDFSDRTPGMIFDHLKALKFKAETSVYSSEQYKKLIAEKVKFHNRLAKREQALEKEIKRKIEKRLIEVLENDLPADEKLVLMVIKKELEPEIRKEVVIEIEGEVRREFHEVSAEKLNLEITAKLNKESRQRIKKKLQEKILKLKRDFEGSTPEIRTEIRKFIEKLVTYYRPNIESKLRVQYAAHRSNELYQLRKVSREGAVRILQKKENFLGKIKKMLGLN